MIMTGCAKRVVAGLFPHHQGLRAARDFRRCGMDSMGCKKMLNLYILEILKRFSDADHRLSQREIIDLVRREYHMECERKAVARNITALMEFGYDIVSDRGYYLNEREFADSELRLLIDSLLFSKHIPYSHCRALIEKLRGLSSEFFAARVSHIRNLPENKPENKQLFYTIDVLDEAIDRGVQVAFHYNSYGTDKELHVRRPEKHIVNPYQMVATHGRFYLVCNIDKYDNIANYRLDRITDIELLDTKVKDPRRVRGMENGLDLPTHMAEHIYMFSGPSVRVRFRADKAILNDIIDWFGNQPEFSNETKGACEVSVRVNEQAMFFWAMQYGSYVEVLEPAGLRNQIRVAAEKMAEKYRAG
jgi:predicted DNA-binding transcriptional regulator YafY